MACSSLSTEGLQGTITYTPDTEAPFENGTTAQYSCQSDLQAIGGTGGTATRTCMTSLSGGVMGVWSGDPVTCECELLTYIG